MNRNDYQSGWDTDQFPNNVPEMALAYYEILQAGGFTTGGTNFDAKLRRQSIDPEDLLIAHIGGMDCCARGLKAAAKMVEDEALSGFVEERYSGWNSSEAQGMLNGSMTLEQIAARRSKPRTSIHRQDPASRNGLRMWSTATSDHQCQTGFVCVSGIRWRKRTGSSRGSSLKEHSTCNLPV
jgi:xylose isomerase